MKATKYKEGFDTIRRHELKKIHPTKQKNQKRDFYKTVNALEIHMSRENAKHMARDAPNVGKQTILRRYEEVRVDIPPEINNRCRAVHDIHQRGDSTES